MVPCELGTMEKHFCSDISQVRQFKLFSPLWYMDLYTSLKRAAIAEPTFLYFYVTVLYNNSLFPQLPYTITHNTTAPADTLLTVSAPRSILISQQRDKQWKPYLTHKKVATRPSPKVLPPLVVVPTLHSLTQVHP